MLQCRHLIPALNARAARTQFKTARLIATHFLGHGCMDDLATDQSFDLQAMCVFADEVLGFGRTRHWLTSGRLVQE